MKIFVLEALHFANPGRPRSLHATVASAAIKAAELVNDLLDWVELPKDATAENWEAKLKEAREARCEEMGVDVDENSLDLDPMGEALGEDNGDVWITEEELQGLEMVDWQAANEVPDQDGEPTIDRRPWPVEIDFNAAGISVYLSHPDALEKHEQRSVWIEIGDHNVVTHCYDPEHDEPLNVRISKSTIAIDHDRGNDPLHGYKLFE